MDRFYKIAQGMKKRFPEGNDPYQMATRLLEECGEVASEINHWEGSGVKLRKLGEPSKQSLAGEIRQAISALFAIAAHYQVEVELEDSIAQSLQKLKNEGYIE